MCDMCATSLMYIGLSWTYASIFQMLRGAVMIFTGIFSVFFLGRKLGKHHWLGMVIVMSGLALVGVSSVLSPSNGAQASNPLGGIVVIVCAQIVQATQMVVEEKFLTKYEVAPLQAVGFEGLWGFLLMSILLVPFYYIPGNTTGGKLENAIDAFVQIGNSYVVMGAVIGNVVSIGFFNFFGITVTRRISATTRMVLDSVRTLVIWMFGLAVGWEKFQYMQAIGFPLLIIGMFVYNGTIKIPGVTEVIEEGSGEKQGEDREEEGSFAGDGDFGLNGDKQQQQQQQQQPHEVVDHGESFRQEDQKKQPGWV